MHQPANVRIVTPDSGSHQKQIRLDDAGCVVLSEADIQRIAAAVVEMLRPPAPAVQEDEYVSVHRNRPRPDLDF